MDATLYTGTGTTNTITNAAGFKPDLVWGKSRSAVQNNGLYDSVRGVNNLLISNSTLAELVVSGVSSFNSNGFSTGSDGSVNQSAVTYVGWQWAAGQGSNVTNTTGTITSTVSANVTAGFSIIKYTGNNTAGATIGHGLGVAPKLVIARRYNAALDWVTWHGSIPASQYLYLNSTAAAATDNTYWNSTAPTSSVITLGSDTGVNGSAYNNICYAWAPVEGYSAFGSYVGNGSSSGPFIYTGFRPAFLMVKCTSTAGEKWYTGWNKSPTYNAVPGSSGAQGLLAPNNTDAESFTGWYQFYSNGFSMNYPGADTNGSGRNYIYMAFAETPFKYANAR